MRHVSKFFDHSFTSWHKKRFQDYRVLSLDQPGIRHLSKDLWCLWVKNRVSKPESRPLLWSCSFRVPAPRSSLCTEVGNAYVCVHPFTLFFFIYLSILYFENCVHTIIHNSNPIPQGSFFSPFHNFNFHLQQGDTSLSLSWTYLLL